MRTYFIHGLGCPAICGTGLAIDKALGQTMTKLFYKAEDTWDNNFASLLSQTEDADHNAIFIGESMGGFFASQLSAHYHARCYLLNPATHPDWQARQFVGPFNAGGRPVTLTLEALNSYAKAPDQRTLLNKGKIGLMLSPTDPVVDASHTALFFDEHAAFVDFVDDGHALGNAESFALIASRVADWQDEHALAYCLRRAGVVTHVIGAVF